MIFIHLWHCMSLALLCLLLDSTNLRRLDHWEHSRAAVVTCSKPVVMILSSQIIMPIVAKVKIIITCGLEYCLESWTQDVSRGENNQLNYTHRETNPCLFVWWCLMYVKHCNCDLCSIAVCHMYWIHIFWVYGYFPWTPLFASRGGHLYTWVIISLQLSYVFICHICILWNS